MMLESELTLTTLKVPQAAWRYCSPQKLCGYSLVALFELLALVPIRKVLTVLPCRLNDVKKQPLDRNCFFYQDFLFRHHCEKLEHYCCVPSKVSKCAFTFLFRGLKYDDEVLLPW